MHLQHTMFFGYDILRGDPERASRRADRLHAPRVHAHLPPAGPDGCGRPTTSLCTEESPAALPRVLSGDLAADLLPAQAFVQSHFSLVDRFIAPSKFLRDRYVDWGIPAERIVVEEYGRVPPPGHVTEEEREPRNRFGYFGQLTPYKGLHVVLEAMRQLDGGGDANDAVQRALAAAGFDSSSNPESDVRLWIHGANLDLQPGPYQNRIKELLEVTSKRVTFIGRFAHDQLAALMSNVDWVIIPSIWWENSPLVIQEAFCFGRPVICSNIGGMAEKVTDGVNGLHFRVGDSVSLAETMRKAVSTPGLWQGLREGIEPVYAMADHVGRLSELYASIEVPAREALSSV